MAREYNYDDDHVSYEEEQDDDHQGAVVLLFVIGLLLALAVYLW